MTSGRIVRAGAGTGVVRRAAPVLVAVLIASAAFHAPCMSASRPKPPPPRYLFAGIPWLVPADSAIARLVERGYRATPKAGDRDRFVCTGRLYEHDAIVTGQLDEERRLVRWVTLVTPRGDAQKWPDMRGVFAEIASETEGRYGPPRAVTEKFHFPYERGDGREDEALRDGLATVSRTWSSKSGDRLTVEISSTVAVVLTYECPEWAALEARRRAKRASDL